jgi:hypothetical protein
MIPKNSKKKLGKLNMQIVEGKLLQIYTNEPLRTIIYGLVRRGDSGLQQSRDTILSTEPSNAWHVMHSCKHPADKPTFQIPFLPQKSAKPHKKNQKQVMEQQT